MSELFRPINFRLSEFDSPDLPGSGHDMKVPFLKQLDYARHIARIPFTITSGYRTDDWNRKVGGTKDSSHLRGYAADIACRNSADRHKIITSLLEVGFNRIGISSNFIHVDNDPNKPAHVVWTY